MILGKALLGLFTINHSKVLSERYDRNGQWDSRSDSTSDRR